MSNKRVLRRGQLLSPYGVGAIVPFPNDESLIVSGIDNWNNDDERYFIEDKRLIKRLKVNQLRFPPDYIEYAQGSANDYSNRYVHSYRFPQWFYCPVCGKMEYYPLNHEDSKDIICDHTDFLEKPKKKPKPRRMVPERFVVVCPDGHLMNFPVVEFLHDGTEFEEPVYDYNKYTIKRISGGESASLSGIKYFCKETKTEKNLGGITQAGALNGIQFRGARKGCCPGCRPWLGEDYNEDCNVPVSKLRVVQRGGTNVWFGEFRSSIYIPENIKSSAEIRVLEVAELFFEQVKNATSDGQIDEKMVNIIATSMSVDPAELLACFKSMIERQEPTIEIEDEDDEDDYRKFEYDAISKTFGSDKHELFVVNKDISEYDEAIRPFFKSVSLIYKMKETRALVGFSRLEPQIGKSLEELKQQLTRNGSTTWVPAIQISGEGIFLEFNKEAVLKWKQNDIIKSRIEKMLLNFNSSVLRASSKLEKLNEEYVMIHTFSHIIINELSKKCGYGSSSIRERLYVSIDKDKDMLGVMLYTSSGDSEGSLGGLVREGLPRRLEDTIVNALIEAEWCSADPFCINSSGQGTNSCNLAACHNCALLPETCCETGNRMLDRAMLIGTIENREVGFFDSLLKAVEK